MKCTSPRIIVRTDVEVPSWIKSLKYRQNVIKDYPDYFMIVPCNHCRECRKAKAREWSIKLLYESEKWSKTSFVTIDYDPEHLPLMAPPPDDVSFSEYYGSLYQAPYNFGCTLIADEVSNYVKRIREQYFRDHGERLHCKYYCCGEYGDKLGRSHYHIIFFGLDASDYALLDKCWGKGFVKIEQLCIETIQYVTGYVRKKLNGKLGSEVYGARLAPFQGYSKGFGLDFFNDNLYQVLQDLRVRHNGNLVSIPRYFLNKNPDVAELVKENQSSPPLLDYLNDPEDFERDVLQRRTDSVRNAQVHTKRSVF